MQRAKQEEKERPRRGGRPCVGLGNLIPARFYERSWWNKRYRDKDASMFVPIWSKYRGDLGNRWMIAMKLFQTIYRNQFYTTTRCRIITGKYIRYYSRYFNFGLNSFARKKEFSFFQISTGYRNVIFFSFRHRRKDWEKINEERILLGRTIIPLNYTKNNRNE